MDIAVKAARGVAPLGFREHVAYVSEDFDKSRFAFWVFYYALVEELFDKLILGPELSGIVSSGGGGGGEVVRSSAEVPYGLRCLAVFEPGMGFAAESGGSGIAIFSWLAIISWNRCGRVLIWCTVIGLEFFCVGIPPKRVIGIIFVCKPSKLACAYFRP